jgi:hypothetical protein
VYLWSCDSGNLELGGGWDVSSGQSIAALSWSPVEHSIAFASFGRLQPVLIYSFDRTAREMEREAEVDRTRARLHRLDVDRAEKKKEEKRREEVKAMAEQKAKEKYNRIAGLLASVTPEALTPATAAAAAAASASAHAGAGASGSALLPRPGMVTTTVSTTSVATTVRPTTSVGGTAGILPSTAARLGVLASPRLAESTDVFSSTTSVTTITDAF